MEVAMIDEVKKKINGGTVDELNLALAPFTLAYTLREFNSTHRLNISPQRWGRAIYHAALFGVSTPAMIEEKHRVTINKQHFATATAFLLDEGNIYELAYGVKTLKLSNGVTLQVPTKARGAFIADMYREYQRVNTDEAGKFDGLSRSAFYEYTKLASDKDPKAIAALDPTAIRHGREAFDQLTNELEILVGISALAKEKHQCILNDIKYTQQHIKNIRRHLRNEKPDMSKPGAFATKLPHCVQCAIGDHNDPSCPDPCAHGTHSDHCRPCASLDLLRTNFEVLISDARRGDQSNEVEIKNCEIILSRIFQRLEYWEAHEFRAAHEYETSNKLLSQLDSNGVLMTLDWKMKFLAYVFRESQSEWYGKHGIPWHGIMFCYQNKQNSDTFEVEYLDQIMYAGQEDANNTFQALTLGVESFMATHNTGEDQTKHKNWCFIKTDGASCYSQQEFARSLATLFDLTGMRVRGHYLGEVRTIAHDDCLV